MTFDAAQSRNDSWMSSPTSVVVASGIAGFANYMIATRSARAQRQMNRDTIDAQLTLARENRAEQRELTEEEEAAREQRRQENLATVNRYRSQRRPAPRAQRGQV